MPAAVSQYRSPVPSAVPGDTRQRILDVAQAAVLELAVLTTRLKMLPPEKVEAELTYLEIAISKTAGEHYVQFSGVDWVTFRLANVIGERNVSGPQMPSGARPYSR